MLKRILAMAGVILLLLLYGSTMVFALMGDSHTMTAFKASLLATIIVPVLLWVYSATYKWIKKHSKELYDKENQKGKD